MPPEVIETRLVRIEMKLDQVLPLLRDHEKRLRIEEQKSGKIAGIAAMVSLFAGGIASWVIAKVTGGASG